MVINNLFPTPVAFFKFGRDLTKTKIKFIKGYIGSDESLTGLHLGEE
jgi:hypothetical protein